ncbi:hypothetical protein [Leuconostoc lactis]|uniref:hypothetical protein n=1 Tax=Leuconostoc lactis TaxID=1246 RepID=UPI00049621F0|nr:hypothetical protein [Leuconostoc lactis]
MKNKKVRHKHGIIVMALILLGLIIFVSLVTKNSSDYTPETTTEETSSSDSYNSYDDSPKIASSGVYSSSSSSSISNFSTDSQTSLANLKADVSTMPKENYENIENEVLKKADFDPTSNNPSASYQIDGIMNALKNVQKLADDAKQLAYKPDRDYTKEDKDKLVAYSNALNSYLIAFKDYATTIYHDKYTSEDPTTSESDKQLLIDEMNSAKNTWLEEKSKWLEQYNTILTQ